LHLLIYDRSWEELQWNS